jgi:hypothetical protein
MAGGFGKQDPKNNKFNSGGFNNEIFKFSGESSAQKPQEKASKFKFNGVLHLGQTIGFDQEKPQSNTWKPEFLSVNHLKKEEESILKEQQLELKKSIDELRTEIKNLVNSTETLDTEVEQAVLMPVIEANKYQLSILQRLKILIINFTRNISEAGVWFESFKGKKQKRNAFWNNVKNKKNGGEQYLFSNEHSVSRSAN